MVLHELATNAAKYGALSDGAGRTEITWLLDAGTFTFRWQDCDGPPALKPAALGFGLTLVQREIAYALGGSVDLSFQPSGLTVTLTFPMEDASRSVATE